MGEGHRRLKAAVGTCRQALGLLPKKRSRKLFLSSMYLLGNRKHLVEGGGRRAVVILRENERKLTIGSERSFFQCSKCFVGYSEGGHL